LTLEAKSTNYLNPKVFYGTFLKWLPRLEPFTSGVGRPASMDADHFVMAARIQYGSALRISEDLRLVRKDFDLNHRILTLHNTKTGWYFCKCVEFVKPMDYMQTRRKQISKTDENCVKCKGTGKISTLQKTTILPYDVEPIEKFLEQHSKDEVLFKTSRQTMWNYYKDVSRLADLNIFEAKDIINIDGAWTHLLRSSCAKMYEDLGAKESMIARKLRHTSGSVTSRYTKIDIGALLDWEDEHLQEIPKI